MHHFNFFHAVGKILVLHSVGKLRNIINGDRRDSISIHLTTVTSQHGLKEVRMQEFGKILFPVSLTDMSPGVAPYVSSMAKKYDAEIHLLHVARALNSLIDTYIVQPSMMEFKKLASDVEKEFITAAENRLELFKKEFFDDFAKIRKTVVFGNHYKEILAYVESEKIDLIIMGTGSPLYKMVIGSVADKVAKYAKIPVMLVKTV